MKKVTFSILCLVSFLVLTLIVKNNHISAHSETGEVFFKINGLPTLEYSLSDSSVPELDLPEDIAPTSYLVNSQISFDIDRTLLPLPKEVLPSLKLNWDMGDGSTKTGFKNTHTYTSAKSFHLKIFYTSSQDSDPQLLESVLIHILPEENYPLPVADILINNNLLSNNLLTTPFKTDFTRPVQLSVTTKENLTNYFWDFGDGTWVQGPKVTHSFNPEQFLAFPILRITDTNGFVKDYFIQLERDIPNTKDTKIPTYIIPIILATTFFGIIVFIKFRHK